MHREIGEKQKNKYIENKYNLKENNNALIWFYLKIENKIKKFTTKDFE
jgi:hypothetical protein